ncbi:hypothetical protein YYC_05015 [Plasmodium yoelii 17X]|uniref:Uncharacterized protein n=1 Tax=Plasmodium yoelii 17X TaxID=1323249 RepID=V7PFT4_PLAYE|nr:hypothetical protein YYC_05015 [Plasmodium yoelii 17X]
MDTIEPYKLSIKKENAHTVLNENDKNKKKNLCSGESLDKYDILLTPEYVQGYFGEKNNILKFSFKKIIYPFKNLIIIYDLLNQSQSIFSKHRNKVILVRCKECYKTALSVEDLKDNVNIYIWNKTNLKILINIKIKKKIFLDINYLNNSNILLLCKWYDKLILFIFSLILCKKKKKVKLRKKGVYIIKSINDFYIKKYEYMKNKPTKNIFKKLRDKGKQKKGNKDSVSRIKHILTTIKKRKKKYMNCLNNYTNINRTSSSYEQNTLKERTNKIYIRKIKKADNNFYFIKNYEKERICFFYIHFVNISNKWKTNNNILLKNFKLFIDIKNTICIFNKKDIFMYVLKNCILYEKLKYKNYKCNFFSNNTKFFLMNQGYHFCSILYMTLFINNLFLSYNFGEITEEEIDMKQNSPHNCVEYFYNENNLLEKNNFVSTSLQNNIIQKYLIPKLDNFLNTEICVIEIITLFVIGKDDDISKIIRLQENIENNCTWRKKKNNKNVEKTYEHFMQKKQNKKKLNSYLKKYLIVGTEDGIIIVIDYLKPHKIMHLEKICNENIASIFVFQNDILILTGLGVLYFINAHNFSTYKYVDIFEILIGKYISRTKCAEASQSFCSNSSIKHDILNYFREYEEEKIQKTVPQNIIRDSFTNIKIDIKKIKNKCLNIKGNNFILSEKKENFFLKTSQPNHENIKKNYDLSEKKKLSNYYNNFNRSSRYICSGILLDIYTLVIGTSLDEIITYNLLTTEMYFIYKKSKNINYFLCENNNIIYNIGNTLYKSSLNNYDNSSTFLTIPNICITAFLFYSDILLICGTMKGNLYFFSISDGNVKVVNKIDKKKFIEEKKRLLLKSKNSQKKNYDNEWVKEKNNDIIFSINKCITKSLRKWNVNNYINYDNKKKIGYNNNFDSIVKESNIENDKIIGLLFNRSKTNLLCSFKHGIFLLRIVVRGNEKVDIKCVRYFNVSNIMNINLVKDFDNLFFITTRENIDIGSKNMTNNKISINQREKYKKHVVEYFYSHHLCSFISVKIKRSKMDKIYFNILFENTWFYEFSYYNDGHFILLENNNKTFDNDQNKCITFLNPSTIIIYSYSINRFNKKHESGNKNNNAIDKRLSQNEKRNSNVILDSRQKLAMCVSINSGKIYNTEEKNNFSKYGNIQTSSFGTKNIFGNKDNFFYDSNNNPISYNNEGSEFHQNVDIKNVDLKNSLKRENTNLIANRTSYNDHDEKKKKKNYTKYKTLRNIIQKRKNIELCNYKNIIYEKNYNDKQILNYIQRNIYYKENKTKENLFFALDNSGEQKQKKEELSYQFNENKKKENFIMYNNEGKTFAKEIGYANEDRVNKSKLYITRYLKKYLQIDIVEENKKKEEKYFSKCVQEKHDKLNDPLINNSKNDNKFISFLNNSNSVTKFSSIYKNNDITMCKEMNSKNGFFQHKIRNMHLENKSTKIIPVENEQINSRILIGTKKMEINKHEQHNGSKEGFPVIRKNIEKYGKKNNYRNMCINTTVPPWKNSLYFNNFYNFECGNNIIDNNFYDIFYDPNFIDGTKNYMKKINSIKYDNDVPHSYNFQKDGYNKNQLFN